mmetsp:Transcript_61132/g.169504  ORF Transcript_61132/g.169504 Transcript_61132/m.169504 type:complete len:318 (-) Transcript_61132:170-1123(-)
MATGSDPLHSDGDGLAEVHSQRWLSGSKVHDLLDAFRQREAEHKATASSRLDQWFFSRLPPWCLWFLECCSSKLLHDFHEATTAHILAVDGNHLPTRLDAELCSMTTLLHAVHSHRHILCKIHAHGRFPPAKVHKPFRTVGQPKAKHEAALRDCAACPGAGSGASRSKGGAARGGSFGLLVLGKARAGLLIGTRLSSSSLCTRCCRWPHCSAQSLCLLLPLGLKWDFLIRGPVHSVQGLDWRVGQLAFTTFRSWMTNTLVIRVGVTRWQHEEVLRIIVCISRRERPRWCCLWVVSASFPVLRLGPTWTGTCCLSGTP